MSTSSDAILAELRTLHPKWMDLSLERIERLLAQLGDPHRHLPPVIHVAGTNGKGSTIAFLKAMLQAAGKRVHVYTSPHLVRFSERIELAGPDGLARPIDEQPLIDLLTRVKTINAGQPITFFEVTTAAAFLAFAETPADFVLLEVGLGGRLDTTNVVDRPALSIITPISMDHMDTLGNTIELIAREKAGILKRGVPAVIAEQPDDASAVISATAALRGVPLIRWDRDFSAIVQGGRMIFESAERLMDLPLPALVGRHQIGNAATAIAAALALPDLQISESAVERGLVEARWPARMQQLTGGVLAQRLPPGSELWLDGGHNAAGGLVIAQAVADLEDRAPKPLCLVVGMKGNKDAAEFLRPLRGLAHRIVTVPMPDAQGGVLDRMELAQIALGLGFTVETASSIPTALDRLKAAGPMPLRVLICGSLYLAGHVLSIESGVPMQIV
jgi:dihydrofolate synthase/folylpolyglutamate synthase